MDSKKQYIQNFIQKITAVRSAHHNPFAPMRDLKNLAMEVGITEEEWNEILNIFMDFLDRGKNFVKHKNWSDAIEELEQAKAIEPNNEEVLYNLALAYENRWWEKRKKKDKELGILNAEKCLELNPQHPNSAKIITDLKNAPFVPWISIQMRWKIASFLFKWGTVAVLAFFAYQYRNQISETTNNWFKQTFKPKDTKTNPDKFVLENVLFTPGSTQLNLQSKNALEKLIKYLNDNPNIKGEIAGHTDNQGLPAVNLKISTARAYAVFEYLISRNIAPNRLTFQGYGDTQPAFSNDTEENRAKNRRIEFRIK
jgi:outer membrane protein OmpA-like peptidoglycan-associated protein